MQENKHISFLAPRDFLVWESKYTWNTEICICKKKIPSRFLWLRLPGEIVKNFTRRVGILQRCLKKKKNKKRQTGWEVRKRERKHSRRFSRHNFQSTTPLISGTGVKLGKNNMSTECKPPPQSSWREPSTPLRQTCKASHQICDREVWTWELEGYKASFHLIPNIKHSSIHSAGCKPPDGSFSVDGATMRSLTLCLSHIWCR